MHPSSYAPLYEPAGPPKTRRELNREAKKAWKTRGTVIATKPYATSRAGRRMVEAEARKAKRRDARKKLREAA